MTDRQASSAARYRDPHSGRTPQESAEAAEKWCRDLPGRYIGIPLTQEPVTLLLEMADAIKALTWDGVLRGK